MNTALKDQLESLKDWIGRKDSFEDVLLPLHVAGLAAMLDRDEPFPKEGDSAPASALWLIRPRWLHQSALGADGHPERGRFMPPVPLPRRMWAGSQVSFGRPLRVGDTVERRSEIIDVAIKEGRGGLLVFVKVRHEYLGGEGLALTENQDVVYREAPDLERPAPPPKPAPPDGAWRRQVTPDAVMLFRYSALTYNGHRIHYDHPYVTKVEGYPGLVVHGPLLATLLLDLIQREKPKAILEQFTFRAMAPVFDTAPFTVSGTPDAGGCEAAVWVKGADGGLAMRGEARFRV